MQYKNLPFDLQIPLIYFLQPVITIYSIAR